MKIHATKLVVALIVLSGCNVQPEGTSSELEQGHPHENDLTITHSVWTKHIELFVEYSPLVVGEVSQFAAHFNDVERFKPLESGNLTVSLVRNKKGIRQKIGVSASSGIFTPSLKPNKAGIYDLKFLIETDKLKDEIVIHDVEVFSSLEAAQKSIGDQESSTAEIRYLKEQAWKTDFATVAVSKDTLYNAQHLGGEAMIFPENDVAITASSSGKIIFRSSNLNEGASIKKGELLFSIVGGDLSNNNIVLEYNKARLSYEKAKSQLERQRALYQSGAIAKPVYEEAKLSYELAEANYRTLSSNFKAGGKLIYASTDGYLSGLNVANNAYVEIGENLTFISNNQRVGIKVLLDPSDYTQLSSNLRASFQVNDQIYTLKDLNGVLKSYGKQVNPNNRRIAAIFEVDQIPGLVPGTYIDTWLETNVSANVMQTPVSALLEDQGQYSVMVQIGGESFEKREVKIGRSNGRTVEIVSGLIENERVVSKGAFAIMMASLSGEVPAHGHAH